MKGKFKELRLEAEKSIEDRSIDISQLSKNQIKKIIHDLEVHQIELEMQNDELLETRIKLEETKNKYFDLFEFAPNGYIRLHNEQVISETNLTFSKLIGYDKSEIINQQFSNFIDPDFQDLFYLTFREIVITKNLKELELKLVTKCKRSIWVKLSLIPNKNTEEYLLTITSIQEIKKATEKINKLNSHLENSLKASNSAWWELSFPSGFVKFNDNKAKMLGYEPKKFKHYKDFMKLVHPDDYELTMQAMRDHINGVNPNYECEYRIKNSNGEYLWFYDVGKIIKSEGINITLTGIARDITKRKNAQQELKESEENYRMLVENQGEGIGIVDLDENFIFSNPAADKIFGITKGKLIGHNLKEFLVSEDMSIIEEETQKRKQGVKSTYEIEIIGANGKNSTVLVTATTQKNKKGMHTGTFGIFRDISNLKKAQQALKESEVKYRTIIEHSNDAIVIRQNGKFEFVNKEFLRMLDYSVIELQRIESSLIFNSDILEDMDKRLLNNDISENPSAKFETEIRKKDKSKVEVEIFEKTISYKEEKAQLIIVHDITKQKEIMKELQEGAEQIKGLRGFIPICAGCSLIRDDEKENKPWVKPANYIHERLPNIKFSHSMCPDCLKKWYPEIKDNE